MSSGLLERRGSRIVELAALPAWRRQRGDSMRHLARSTRCRRSLVLSRSFSVSSGFRRRLGGGLGRRLSVSAWPPARPRQEGHRGSGSDKTHVMVFGGAHCGTSFAATRRRASPFLPAVRSESCGRIRLEPGQVSGGNGSKNWLSHPPPLRHGMTRGSLSLRYHLRDGAQDQGVDSIPPTGGDARELRQVGSTISRAAGRGQSDGRCLLQGAAGSRQRPHHRFA